MEPDFNKYGTAKVSAFYNWLIEDRHKRVIDITKPAWFDLFKLCVAIDPEIINWVVLSKDHTKLVFLYTYNEYKNQKYYKDLLKGVVLESEIEKMNNAFRSAPKVEEPEENKVNYKESKNKRRKKFMARVHYSEAQLKKLGLQIIDDKNRGVLPDDWEGTGETFIGDIPFKTAKVSGVNTKYRDEFGKFQQGVAEMTEKLKSNVKEAFDNLTLYGDAGDIPSGIQESMFESFKAGAGLTNTGRIKSRKVVVNGIEFDSTMEGDVYKGFLRYGIEVEIKPVFVLDEGFMYRGKKVSRMVHTPDFYVPSVDMLVEVKGYENDRYAMQKRLLKKTLSQMGKKSGILTLCDEKDIDFLMTLIISAGQKKDTKDLEYFFGPSLKVQRERKKAQKTTNSKTTKPKSKRRR